MKILLLGARGMLGQELSHVFSNHAVTALDRSDLDITSRTDVIQKIRDLKPEIILNAAAYNAVDKAEDDEAAAFSVNAEAVQFLAQASAEKNALLVHFSTDYVFDGEQKEGYAEDDPVNPQSAYARSKAAGERYLQEIGGRFYLIRLSRLFGKPGIGGSAKTSFVDLMIRLAGEKIGWDVVDEEDSCPTYAPDLALRTREIIDEGRPFGVYHGTNSGSCTWYGFAQEILKQKNISRILNPVSGDAFPRKAQRPKYSILRNTKLPQMRSWQEALKEYLGAGSE